MHLACEENAGDAGVSKKNGSPNHPEMSVSGGEVPHFSGYAIYETILLTCVEFSARTDTDRC